MLADFNKRLNLAARVLFTGRMAPQMPPEIPMITPEQLVEVREFFPMEKFFIFGHARSGTTLLVRLIRQHPQVHCNYQAHFFTRPPLLQSLVANAEVRSWLSRRSNRWNQGSDPSSVVLRAVADFIMERDARREGKSIVGDKSPNSLLNGEAVRLMQKIYPDARLIFIVRDGRDALISHRIQNFIDASQHLSREDLEIREEFNRRPESFLGGQRSLFSEKGFHRAVEGWVKNVQETDQLGKQYYGESYISLRYEDLLKQPWDALSRLWSFLGVDLTQNGLMEALNKELGKNPDADWQRQKAGDLIEPLRKGKQGSWRELFTVTDKQIFKSIGGQTLINWAYERDLNW